MADMSSIEPYRMPKADDLPANVAGWRVEPDRAVLLIHDMQHYFVRPFPTGRPPGDDLVRNIASLREHCSDLGVQIAYTAQPGGMTDEQRGLLKDFWGPGMRVDPADRQVVGPLRPAPDDWVFTKWRYSAFFRSDLLARMRRTGRDQLIVCGVYAHVGVLMTAVEAFTNDIETFLVADAVADFSKEFHWLAVDYAVRRCAVVGTTDSMLAQLDSAASLPGVTEAAV